MKVNITGTKTIVLLPENDADKALLESWDKMRPCYGGGCLGSRGIESLSIVFMEKKGSDT